MQAVKGTWTGGRIVPDGPVDWPEGSRLVIQQDTRPDVEFLTEEGQSDAPEAVERWIQELREIPPLPMTPKEEEDFLAWRKRVKEASLEAVRRQMEESR